MKLHVLCDCDDNKVVTGNWDGQPMWHYKDKYKFSIVEPVTITNSSGQSRIVPKSEWTEWMKDEAYKQNSD